MKVRAAIGLHCSWVWIKTGSQKGSKMRSLKLLTLLGICSICLVAVPYAHAQRVGAGSGVAPGYAGQANGNPAYGDPGYGNQASGDPAYGDPGYGNQASGNPAYGNQSANVPEDLRLISLSVSTVCCKRACKTLENTPRQRKQK